MPDPRPGIKWVLLATILPGAMISLDMTIVSVALVPIQGYFNASAVAIHWIMTSYILAFAATVALSGRISDKTGPTRSLVAGVVLFMAASVLCGLANNEYFLIAGRSLQGLGSGLIQPSAMAIIINRAGKDRVGRMMSIYIASCIAFLTIGPLIGGGITQYLSWRFVFWLNLPIGILAIIFLALASPPKTGNPAIRLDIIGAVTLVVSMGAITLGLQQGNSWGWSSFPTLAACLGGLALLAVFLLGELRLKDPLIDIRIFRTQEFLVDIISMFCVRCGIMGLTVSIALYLQHTLGMKPFSAGIAIMPVVLAFLFGTLVSGVVFDKIGARLPIFAGMLLMAAGFSAIAFLSFDNNYLRILPGLLVVGAGAGLLSAATTDAVSRVKQEIRGQISGIIQTVRQAGGICGIAAMGGLNMNQAGFKLASFRSAAIIAMGLSLAFFFIPLYIRIKKCFKSDGPNKFH